MTGRKHASLWFDLLPQTIVAATVLWAADGVAARWLAGVLAAAPGPTADTAFVTAGRTAVLSVTAVALAWSGRRWRVPELTWLVYPVLVWGGVRLVLEDLRYGRPITPFLALALRGSALIVTPRLVKREH